MIEAEASRGEADENLAVRAAGGDMAAFETLYRRHVRRVNALCLRMTRSPHVAEELVQEVFVRAWRSLRSFRGDSAFSSWLYRVSVNVVMSHFRSRGRIERHEQEVAEPERLELSSPTVEPGTGVDLERAVGGLPEGARAVFLLHDVHGLKHEEIAAAMEIAVGTSKAQLHRARALLREALQ